MVICIPCQIPLRARSEIKGYDSDQNGGRGEGGRVGYDLMMQIEVEFRIEILIFDGFWMFWCVFLDSPRPALRFDKVSSRSDSIQGVL